MLCSTLVTFCTLNITFCQRTSLGMSANQKRHYLKSYNNTFYRTLCDPFSANQPFQIIYKNDKLVYITRNIENWNNTVQGLFRIILQNCHDNIMNESKEKFISAKESKRKI
jgi:hypothetical protein